MKDFLNNTFKSMIPSCLMAGFVILLGNGAFAQMTFSSTPMANANNVPVNVNIELDFDTDIDLISVHINSTNANEVYDDNIKIIGSQSGQFQGTFSNGADISIVVFDPSIPFKAGEKITVVVNASVLGTGGEVAIARSFSFIAASGPFEGAFLERPTAGIQGMADGQFDWGDYDGDGDLDLIVVGFDPSYTASAIIYNNSGGTFTDIGAVLTGVFFGTAEWGDYDNDGDLDVVVAGVDDTGTTRTTTIYENNAGVFTDSGIPLQGVDYAALDWGDYDNDGDLDLVVIGRYANPAFGADLISSTIYQNNGGVFTDIGAGLLPLYNGSVDWGDYDADGDLDLVMTGFDADFINRYTIIYDNNGGIFSDHGAGLPNVAWGDTDWGDYDNDGDLDLLLMGDGPVLTITSIFNNAGGVFTDINAGLPTTSEGSTRWGDFDGDGDLDLIITGNDYSTGTEITNIFRNDGGNVFTDINAGLQTVYFTGLADWGDFDGDGDLDLLVAGESTIDPSSTSAILYENAPPPFITTWQTTDGQIIIPTNSISFTYNYNVKWKNLTNAGVGDGYVSGQTGDLTITGLTNGDTYQVDISGTFPAIYFNVGAVNAIKIRTVEQWGGMSWASFNSAFRGCTNLVFTAPDTPDLSAVTDLGGIFMLCTNFNSNINMWDVSNVTDFSLMFYQASAFNQPLDNWDVSNAVDMSYMFENAISFNQAIGSWDVGNVTNARNMFSGASLFNQDIGGWNVSSVTNFNSMFLTAIAFNQDISGWNVSNGNSFRFMFEDASSFNQNLGNWDISNATNLGSMLSGAGLSVSNYDQTLIGWEALATTPTFQNLGASGLFYCAGAVAHSNLISTYGWTIDDAGQLCVGGEIAVFEGATTTGVEIFDGQVTALDFGTGTQGSNLTRQFTIENQGSSALNITSITISGTAYSLLTVPPASIGGGLNQTLDIQLSGATAGTFNETVTIASDDADEGTFTFPITGVITVATCSSPPTANAGSNQSICEGTAVSLSGTITNAISPAWSTAGDGIFDNTNILTPVYSPGAGDISTGSITLTLTTEDPDGAGPCAAATSQVVITIDGAASVNAGTDITLCPTNTVGLTGTMSANASNPMWSTSGTGTFSTPNNLNSTYSPSASDITAGTVTLTLTVDGSGVCPQVADQLIVTIVPPIVAGTPSIQPAVSQAFNVDVLATSTINTGDIIAITILQNPVKGSVTVLGNNTIDYIASTGTIGADSFEYQICNQCGSCSVGIVSVTIANAPPVITPPSSPLASVAGQSVTIPFSTYFSDLNDNIDFNAISILTGPTSTAPATFDSNYDLTIDYSATPFAGTDQLTIQVCDLSGACAQIDLSIEVDGEITVHNGMSPNGDGFNDYFKINNIQFIEPQNKVSIYNRWGDKVFEMENYDSTNPAKHFNGKSDDGKDLPSGVYFYKISFASGTPALSGYLTLKR